MRHRRLVFRAAVVSVFALSLATPSLAATGSTTSNKSTASSAKPTPVATAKPGTTTNKPGASKPAPVKPAAGKPAPGKPTNGKPPTSNASKKPVQRGRPAPTKKGPPPKISIPAGWPKLLSIPRIGVNKVAIEALALTRPEDVHAPYKWGDVGWYDRGPRPGDRGRAAMFGHLDSTCCPAVFWHLKDLKAGDTIQIYYKSGTPLTFRVLWSGIYPNSALPVKFMYANTYEHGVTLTTCSGAFHQDGIGYDHKLVVYARLVLANGSLG